MKIIVETEEQKQEILKQSEYIHDFLINKDDIKDLGKDWLIGLDSDKAGILMHLYMTPQIIEVRQSEQSNSSQSALYIMSEIDKAIKKFGEYSFDDKGPWEVMNFDSIVKDLKDKSMKEIGSILSEVLDHYSNQNRAMETVSCIISELDYLPEDQFDELLNSDERFEY